jgi:hypothetical protein
VRACVRGEAETRESQPSQRDGDMAAETARAFVYPESKPYQIINQAVVIE